MLRGALLTHVLEVSNVPQSKNILRQPKSKLVPFYSPFSADSNGTRKSGFQCKYDEIETSYHSKTGRSTVGRGLGVSKVSISTNVCTGRGRFYGTISFHGIR